MRKAQSEMEKALLFARQCVIITAMGFVRLSLRPFPLQGTEASNHAKYRYDYFRENYGSSLPRFVPNRAFRNNFTRNSLA